MGLSCEYSVGPKIADFLTICVESWERRLGISLSSGPRWNPMKLRTLEIYSLFLTFL